MIISTELRFSFPLVLCLIHVCPFRVIQFCDAGTEIPSSKLLIKGGTVVNGHHQQMADVYVEDGIIVAVNPNFRVFDELKPPSSSSA